MAELRAKSECDSALFPIATLKARVAQLESLVSWGLVVWLLILILRFRVQILTLRAMSDALFFLVATIKARVTQPESHPG